MTNATNATLWGKPDKVASAKPRRGALLYNMKNTSLALLCGIGIVSMHDVSADTLGLWLLDGEAGASATYGSMPNEVAGSPLTLDLAVAGTMSGAPKYLGDRRPPVHSLYSDIALTNRLMVFNRGLLMLNVKNSSAGSATAAQDWANSHYLRIPTFGKELSGKDFTVEVITAQPKFNSYNGGNDSGRIKSTIVSISAPGNAEPGFRMTSFNRGTFYYKGNTAEQRLSNGWLNYVGTSGTSWFEDNWIWHHFAFVYTTSDKTMRIIKDYTESTAVLPMTADGANGIPMDESSFLQISGPLGTVTPYGTPLMYVAAVRVSSEALNYKKFMTLARGPEDFATDPVIGWWRMESGTLGESLLKKDTNNKVYSDVIPNEKTSAYCPLEEKLCSLVSYKGYYDGNLKKWNHVGVSAVFDGVGSKNRIGETNTPDRVNWKPNALSLASSQHEAMSNGLKLYVPRLPEIGLPGSFTCECFVRKDMEGTISGTAQTRVDVMGTGTWGVWDSYDFHLAPWYFKTVDGVKGGLNRPQINKLPMIPADRKWHHVALVYDRPSATSKKYLRLYFDYTEITAHAIEFAENEDLAWESDGTLDFVGSCQAGGQGTGSWWGAADELRFTRAALTPSQFLRRYSDKGIVLVVR